MILYNYIINNNSFNCKLNNLIYKFFLLIIATSYVNNMRDIKDG